MKEFVVVTGAVSVLAWAFFEFLPPTAAWFALGAVLGAVVLGGAMHRPGS